MIRPIVAIVALVGICGTQVHPVKSTKLGYTQTAAAGIVQSKSQLAEANEELGEDFTNHPESSGGDRPS
jgi:hypothetical protein